MFKRIDRSPILSRLISRLAEFMAKRRGLPVVLGIGLVLVSFVIQVADVFSNSRTLELLGVFSLNIGVLLALIGLLLADPLGK